MKTNSRIFDIIVVGGGPAGAAAASVFVKEGLAVAMIDGANVGGPGREDRLEDFETVRKTNLNQDKLFLGQDLSGINLSGESHASTQASGDKRYVTKDVKDVLPTKSHNVEILQTLAKGGLTEIWGANCDFYNPDELEQVGLKGVEMQKFYQEIIDDIGVSGNNKQFKMQPPARIDHNARKILKVYGEKVDKFNSLGLKMHLPYLAMLTKDKSRRKATAYNDMEYWSDKEAAVYRVRYTIEELEKKSNFSYIKGVVISLKEKSRVAEVITNNGIFKAKFVILAAGPLGTGRILLKSFDLYGVRLPFLAKSHIVTPCLLPANLGKKGDVKKYSFCQLIMESTATNIQNYSYTQFYSYKSLLLYKLLGFSPFSTPETLSILSLISSSLVLADTRFGVGQRESGYCFLQKNSNGRDTLNVIFKKVDKKDAIRSELFGKVLKGIKSAGLIPLTKVSMPYGSTAHYSGILSSKSGLNKSLKLDKDGKLERSRRIYVADSSGWDALPAKPPTLTIMANARRISVGLLKNFEVA